MPLRGAMHGAKGAPAIFPLSVAPNGRYLQTIGAAPFILKGDAPWEAIGELSASEWATYLATRKAQRFNALVMQLINPVKYVAS